MTDAKVASLNIQADFALQFLRNLQSGKLKSSILSPISIMIDLGLIWNGTSGETAKQIEAALTKKIPGFNFNKCFVPIIKQTRGISKEFSLISVHQIFVKRNMQVLTKFQNRSKIYGRDVISMDNDVSQKNSDEANKLIQKFVGTSFDDIALVLINIMHFNGELLTHFREGAPFKIPEKFYVSENDFRWVYMLESHFEKEYLYEDADTFEVVGIEYKEAHTMFIVLPKERFGLKGVLEKLDASTMLELAKNKAKRICMITMPRLKFDFEFDAKELLMNLGIRDALNPQTADFSNISNDKSLFLQNFLHRSSITLFENGNESDFMFSRPSFQGPGGRLPPFDITFTVDHPFLYFIVDKYLNILFIGTVVDNFQPYADNISYEERLQNALGPESLRFEFA